MSNQYLKLRRSSVPGKIPTTSSIDLGELALNTNNGWALMKRSGSYGEEVIMVGSHLSGSLNLTGSINIYSGSISKTDYIDFNTSSLATGLPGRLKWNDTDGTLDIGLKGGNVTLQVGQEQLARVVNGSGVDLLEADYQVVKITGAQGQRLQVLLAQANNDANSATTLGVVTETILKNQEGFITILGQVREINTTGTLQGETWTDGDILYLSPFVAGKLTNIKPVAPNHSVIVGYVEYAHAIHGKIFVKVDNGYEIDELHNVYIDTGSLTSGQSLVRSGSVWTNSNQLTGSLFGTSSWAQNSISSSTTILSSNLLANQTVGGVSSGTTFTSGSSLENILRNILVTYIPPTLSSLTVRSGGSTISTAARDVGNSFIINSASFSATADNPTGIFPLSASFTGSSADIGTFSYYFGNNVLSTSNVLSLGSTYTINRATTAGTVTFTVNGRRSDTGALITGASTSISFQWRNYLAASSTIPTDNATAQTVVNATVQSVLDSDRAWTATCTAANNNLNNYTYIIYPASYGDLTNIIRNGASPELGAFEKLGDFTITNAYSATILVRIYKSFYQAAYSPGDALAIS